MLIPQAGILVALAWPKTYCKGTGAWYDGLAEKLGISKNNYYPVGHAALVLVDGDSGAAEYFDFGRYHCPKGFGKVRSAKNDPALDLDFLPKFQTTGNLANLRALLDELNTMPQCKGDGPLIAAQSLVNYKKARAYITQLEEKKFIPYGPFVRGGTNCARFVYGTLNAGLEISNWRLKLVKYPSPLPLLLIKSLGKTSQAASFTETHSPSLIPTNMLHS